jgi:hypothetical protein
MQKRATNLIFILAMPCEWHNLKVKLNLLKCSIPLIKVLVNRKHFNLLEGHQRFLIKLNIFYFTKNLCTNELLHR